MLDSYIQVVSKALEDSTVSVSVGDMCEDYYDLVQSNDLDSIVEACEATDTPVLHFFQDDESMGVMSVLVGYGDESISDYHTTEFLESLLEGSV